MSKEWPDFTADIGLEYWAIEVEKRIGTHKKRLDEMEGQHLDRRIIELDDVMRNNFTRRLDELEESYKDHLDWASTHGHPDPPQETPTGHAEFICDSCGKTIGEHDKYVVHETYRHFECAGFLPQETPTEEPDNRRRDPRCKTSRKHCWAGSGDDDYPCEGVDTCGEAITEEPEGKLKPCPCCAGIAERQMDGSVFAMSDFGDRYPPKVSKQSHGYQVRCAKCGLKTCWWHYEKEADDAWNRRVESEELLRLRAKVETQQDCFTQTTMALNQEISKLEAMAGIYRTTAKNISDHTGIDLASMAVAKGNLDCTKCNDTDLKAEIARLKDEIEDLTAQHDRDWLVHKQQTDCYELQTEEVSKLKTRCNELFVDKLSLEETCKLVIKSLSCHWCEKALDIADQIFALFDEAS